MLKFLSDREFVIYCYAISVANDCLICSTFFRKEIATLDIDVEHFELTKQEEHLEVFGRMMASSPNNISDEVFACLQKTYSAEQMVLLSAFGAMMIATNVINNVLKVDLDDRLVSYLPKGDNHE